MPNLTLLALYLPLELFTAELVGVLTPIRRCYRLPRTASCCRTHPPYVKSHRGICPAKSMAPPELLRLEHYQKTNCIQGQSRICYRGSKLENGILNELVPEGLFNVATGGGGSVDNPNQ